MQKKTAPDHNATVKGRKKGRSGAERARGALTPFALGKWLKALGAKATEDTE